MDPQGKPFYAVNHFVFVSCNFEFFSLTSMGISAFMGHVMICTLANL